MNSLITFMIVPVLVVYMTYIHFIADWIFQSHSDAMTKHDHFWIRTKHCLIYTAFFIPFFLFLQLGLVKIVISCLILFVSHHIEDTYVPVVLWAKYIRRPPEMSEYSERVKFYEGIDPNIGFKDFVATPLGKILMIVVDQLVHILFLWVIAFIAVI